VLPLSELWSKFLLVLALLPLLAVVDAWLLRSEHGLSFWIRACGFEACSVFGAAAVARWVFNIAGTRRLSHVPGERRLDHVVPPNMGCTRRPLQ